MTAAAFIFLVGIVGHYLLKWKHQQLERYYKGRGVNANQLSRINLVEIFSYIVPLVLCSVGLIIFFYIVSVK